MSGVTLARCSRCGNLCAPRIYKHTQIQMVRRVIAKGAKVERNETREEYSIDLASAVLCCLALVRWSLHCIWVGYWISPICHLGC